MNDEGEKNNNGGSDGKSSISYATTMPNEVFSKLDLFCSIDDNGKYWEIIPRKGEVLRSSDLKRLSEWILCEIRDDSRSAILDLSQISGILDFHALDDVDAGNPEDQSIPRKVVRALRYLEKKIAVLEADKKKLLSTKWRTYDVPDDFDGLLIAEVELSDGGKQFFLCVIDENGMLCDPETGDDFGWDFECISRWVPFDDVFDWASGGKS